MRPNYEQLQLFYFSQNTEFPYQSISGRLKFRRHFDDVREFLLASGDQCFDAGIFVFLIFFILVFLIFLVFVLFNIGISFFFIFLLTIKTLK
jgi:hypothetical protein